MGVVSLRGARGKVGRQSKVRYVGQPNWPICLFVLIFPGKGGGSCQSRLVPDFTIFASVFSEAGGGGKGEGEGMLGKVRFWACIKSR